MSEFQRQVRKKCIAQLKSKDRTHFGISEGKKGPREVIFRQIDFKPLVFGSFAEMSSNAKDIVDKAVEYGVEHIGVNMASMKSYVFMVALIRRYRAQLSLAT